MTSLFATFHFADQVWPYHLHTLNKQLLRRTSCHKPCRPCPFLKFHWSGTLASLPSLSLLFNLRKVAFWTRIFCKLHVHRISFTQEVNKYFYLPIIFIFLLKVFITRYTFCVFQKLNFSRIFMTEDWVVEHESWLFVPQVYLVSVFIHVND